MSGRSVGTLVVGGLALVTSVLVVTPAEPQAVQARYVYSLSNFTGSLREDFVRVVVDRERSEVYTLYQNIVRVFNESGMEVFHFGGDLDLGHVLDVAIDEAGDVLLLAYRDAGAAIVRCTYRGQPRSEVRLTGFPGEFADFGPNRMSYQNGSFFLASSMGLKVVVADRQGRFVRGHDLIPLFDLTEKDRGNLELGGFSVDGKGNVLMTVPVLFRAFVLSPEGKVATFGQAGSAPGRFNHAAGIARDRRGNILVVDKLKGAVLVFDGAFRFVSQFSARGRRPGELIVPSQLALDDRDRVYVTQAANRGVSVFALTYR